MNPLLIFGASTRAAAFSAIRAGFNPICGDLFADADLRAFAEVLNVPDYPHHLTHAARHLPPNIPWVFTGALENSPSELERLSTRHTLWGNSAAVLRRCRDPWRCFATLQEQGILAIELCSSTLPPPRDKTWLMKPLRSSAGRAISVWDAETKPLAEPHYFQRFIAGTPIAGAFLAGQGGTYLLGVSQQLIGVADMHAPEFGYCGSIFPCPAPALINADGHDRILQIGTAISREFGLRGLFGIDFIYDGQQIWMTEINPRYTASMELIEYGRQLPLLDLHRNVFEKSTETPMLAGFVNQPDRYCAKVILYADRHAHAPDLSCWIPSRISIDELPRLADIPVTGTEIQPGQPVFTCLGEGANPEQLLQELSQRAHELWQTFPA